jgi:hypothetical protein
MPPFTAEAVFRFEAESVEAAGAELRRLALAARAVGFQIEQGRAEARSTDADEDDGWTNYGHRSTRPLRRPRPEVRPGLTWDRD